MSLRRSLRVSRPLERHEVPWPASPTRASRHATLMRSPRGKASPRTAPPRPVARRREARRTGDRSRFPSPAQPSRRSASGEDHVRVARKKVHGRRAVVGKLMATTPSSAITIITTTRVKAKVVGRRERAMQSRDPEAVARRDGRPVIGDLEVAVAAEDLVTQSCPAAAEAVRGVADDVIIQTRSVVRDE